ncbi:hypothetical protein GIB67_010206 [Kingdonia uniflora]|uniref:Myb/SANT-like domain-containing protein n=1 Tax=Kingdonia uniflora TaxID=39325 RepID=A0A7J7NAQ0_9MAGN|nr:hypothetical protein GIB67_010206 [Kingdonia uniflora]
MPPKNKKAKKEVTDDPSQDTPNQAKLLNGEKLHTFLALCKHELEITKDVGFGILKAYWAKIREEYNARLCLTRGTKYFSNGWLYQRVKYNAWTWLLRRTGNGYNTETRTFHILPEEWDALIKINESVNTFRKGRLPHEDLMEAIFANRVATSQYATGPARISLIWLLQNITADFNIEDENNVTTDLVERDTDT